MASKRKSALKELSKKSVKPGPAGNVKGGAVRSGRLATNHNQTLRVL
jgi:hypothetical protein